LEQLNRERMASVIEELHEVNVKLEKVAMQPVD